MKILVTGSKGFIASGLMGEGIDGIDIKEGIDIVTYQAKKKYDIVIHTAALTSVTESLKDPESYVRTNVFGTMRMVRQHPEAHFIYLSTAGVYGEGKYHTVWSETHPGSFYAKTKLWGEELVREWAKSWAVLRLTNVIGPGVKGEPNVYQIFEKKKILPIYGDGMQTRDFVRVENVRKAIIAAINLKNKTVNIGSGKSTTVLDVAKSFNKPIRFYPARPGDIQSSGVQDAFNYSSVA